MKKTLVHRFSFRPDIQNHLERLLSLTILQDSILFVSPISSFFLIAKGRPSPILARGSPHNPSSRPTLARLRILSGLVHERESPSPPAPTPSIKARLGLDQPKETLLLHTLHVGHHPEFPALHLPASVTASCPLFLDRLTPSVYHSPPRSLVCWSPNPGARSQA